VDGSRTCHATGTDARELGLGDHSVTLVNSSAKASVIRVFRPKRTWRRMPGFERYKDHDDEQEDAHVRAHAVIQDIRVDEGGGWP
jgi:hypothetical protein